MPEDKKEDAGLQFPDMTGPEFDTHDGLGAPWEHELPEQQEGYWP